RTIDRAAGDAPAVCVHENGFFPLAIRETPRTNVAHFVLVAITVDQHQRIVRPGGVRLAAIAHARVQLLLADGIAIDLAMPQRHRPAVMFVSGRSGVAPVQPRQSEPAAWQGEGTDETVLGRRTVGMRRADLAPG